MTAEQKKLADLERLLRVCTWLLRISSVIALALVSWGSYSVIRWLGMPIPVAVAYPLVIDMAMLYVTPFAVNAMLPNTEEWPIRRRASRIRAFVWLVVAAFNELHAVMMVWQTAAIPTEGPMRWVAYGCATIVGIGPVVFYGYAYQIEAMVTAWVTDRRAEILIEAESEVKAEVAADKAAERKTAERVAVVAAKAQAAAVAPASPAPQPREAAPVSAPTASGKRTPEQEALLASLPGRRNIDKAEAWALQQLEAGDEVTGADVAAALGTDPSDSRKAVRQAKAAIEARGRLTVVGG